MIVFTRRRDEPFCLVATMANHGHCRPSFEHYATVVPVKIRGRQVEACFLTRWDTHVRRLRAVHSTDRPLARPGDPGYRRYRNLKLTLAPDDPVLIRRSGAGAGSVEGNGDDVPGPGPEPGSGFGSDVVIRLVTTRPGRAEFSVMAGLDHVVDLTEFDQQRELQIRDVLERLNQGDAWDRVADL
jgi:hypothetical protein